MKSLLGILHIGRQNRVAVQGSTGFPWDLQKSIKCEIHLSLMNFCEITCVCRIVCGWESGSREARGITREAISIK